MADNGQSQFPGTRMRRNRAEDWVRCLTRESSVSPHDLIWPMFVQQGSSARTPVPSMPGVERLSIDLFQIPSSKMPLDNSLEENAQAALQSERVRAAISQLPDEQREPLQLAFFKGYTHREIADILDQPLGTVKTRIRLAMGKLRKILLDEEPSSGE